MSPILVHVEPGGTQPAGWEYLQRIRSKQPAAASEGDRSQTFQAALGQFEALFTAARQVSNESRPILLFYGVSQAVRAVAAAAPALRNEQYLLRGHGQKVSDLTQKDVRALTCKLEKTGSLPTLMDLLGMERWQSPVGLGQLWAAIPGLDPLREDDTAPVAVEADFQYDSTSGSLVREVTARWIPMRTFNVDMADDRAVLQAALAMYPTLGDTADPEPRQHAPASWSTPQMVGRSQRHVSISRSVPTRPDHADYCAQVVMDDKWLIPTLGGSASVPEHLVLWWSLLHALSMRARYEPRGWRHDLDMDVSPSAVPLDKAMKQALRLAPELIASAIRKVSS